MTEAEFCGSDDLATTAPDSVNFTNTTKVSSQPFKWNPVWSHALHAFVLLLVIVQSAVEINNVRKLKGQYVDRTLMCLRLPFLGLALLGLLPASICGLTHGIKAVWLWQCSLVSLVLAWFLLVYSVNLLPHIFILSSITWQFQKQFAKGVLIMGMLITMFTLVFHVMLSSHKGFTNFWQTIMIMMVWLVGDYGYSDTFVDDTKLDYPILANVMFFVFICSVFALFIQLIKSPSLEESELLYYQMARRVNLLLNIDACLPDCFDRKKYVLSNFGKHKSSSKVISAMKKVISTSTFHPIASAGKNECDECDRSDAIDVGEECQQYSNLQDYFKEQTRKMDEVLAFSSQVMETYHKLNEQVLEIKQKLVKQSPEEYQKLSDQVAELDKKLEAAVVRSERQQIKE